MGNQAKTAKLFTEWDYQPGRIKYADCTNHPIRANHREPPNVITGDKFQL